MRAQTGRDTSTSRYKTGSIGVYKDACAFEGCTRLKASRCTNIGMRTHSTGIPTQTGTYEVREKHENSCERMPDLWWRNSMYLWRRTLTASPEASAVACHAVDRGNDNAPKKTTCAACKRRNVLLVGITTYSVRGAVCST